MTTDKPAEDAVQTQRILAALGTRNIVLIGMMGAGKTSVGKRLAMALGIPFTDADHEIETAANMTIPEIFETYGEDHFRDGERKVIARLLRDGPKVIATGGGAIVNTETRKRIARKSISIWLKADLQILLERVRRRSNRPLLRSADPEAVLRGLLAEREPLYAQADITVTSRNSPHQTIINEILGNLEDRLASAATQPAGTREQRA
jgi:shikimate kinase